MSTRTTASSLRARSDQGAIRDMINTHVRAIDAKIESANSKGLGAIKYEISSTYTLVSMDKKDSQLLLISELLKLYSESEPEGRGMSVEYERATNEYGKKIDVIYISWLNGMSDSERRTRAELIGKFMKK